MAARKREDLSYSEASGRLEAILRAIESGEADLDELSARVEEAAALIQICREKLASTELKVKKVVEDLVKEEEGDSVES